MSHFAKIENGVVTQVIVATQEEINSERHGDAFLWTQCSYNSNFGGAYPSIGYTYNKETNIFTEPKPFDSWILVNNSWEAPKPIPEIDDPQTESSIIYAWNETTQVWENE